MIAEVGFCFDVVALLLLAGKGKAVSARVG